MTRKILILLLALSILNVSESMAAGKEKIKTQLDEFMLGCNARSTYPANSSRVEAFRVDDANRELVVTVSNVFASQAFTASSVKSLYKKLARALSKPYSRYRLRLVACGLPIEEHKSIQEDRKHHIKGFILSCIAV